MEYLSNVSDKAQIMHYGETYEKRKLVILFLLDLKGSWRGVPDVVGVSKDAGNACLDWAGR